MLAQPGTKKTDLKQPHYIRIHSASSYDHQRVEWLSKNIAKSPWQSGL